MIVNILASATFITGIVVRNTLVTYDRAHDRIGFWKTNCSEVWKGQHMTVAPAPAPSNSPKRDENPELPPTQAPAPTEFVFDDLSGRFGYEI